MNPAQARAHRRLMRLTKSWVEAAEHIKFWRNHKSEASRKILSTLKENDMAFALFADPEKPGEGVMVGADSRYEYGVIVSPVEVVL